MKVSREEQFYDSLLVKNGFELITIEGYKRVLKKFIRDIGTDNPKREQAEGYLAKMRKKDYSYSHIANTGVAITRYGNSYFKVETVERFTL